MNTLSFQATTTIAQNGTRTRTGHAAESLTDHAWPVTAEHLVPIAIGITGHRDLRPQDIPQLEATLRGVLRELRQRYREGQEDQLGALGLVVNIIVLWNTMYMAAAIDQLKLQGFLVKEEDVARLSPLTHEHINMLGRYSFTIPDEVANGKLRPLHCTGDDI